MGCAHRLPAVASAPPPRRRQNPHRAPDVIADRRPLHALNGSTPLHAMYEGARAYMLLLRLHTAPQRGGARIRRRRSATRPMSGIRPELPTYQWKA